MPPAQLQARHVIHVPTSGEDRARAYAAICREPVFRWGGSIGPSPLLGGVKAAFRSWLQESGDAVLTVYHDGVGADVLAPLDPCERKILFQHCWPPGWQRSFDLFIRGTGKVLVEDPIAYERIRAVFGWIPERYLKELAPIRLPPTETSGGEDQDRVTGIWLQDRSWRRFGNRLRSIADRWTQDLGRLEFIVASGGPPSWARKQGLRWHSDLEFEKARRRATRWQSVFLLNDEDLLAPWLLDAIAAGAFPLVPDSGRAITPSLWMEDAAPNPYPWGDIPAALERLQQWQNTGPTERASFHAWTAKFPPSCSEGWLHEGWLPALELFAGQRPPRLRNRRPWCSLYPLRWYERLLRLRSA
jgi:hypothetical protein